MRRPENTVFFAPFSVCFLLLFFFFFSRCGCGCVQRIKNGVRPHVRALIFITLIMFEGGTAFYVLWTVLQVNGTYRFDYTNVCMENEKKSILQKNDPAEQIFSSKSSFFLLRIGSFATDVACVVYTPYNVLCCIQNKYLLFKQE